MYADRHIGTAEPVVELTVCIAETIAVLRASASIRELLGYAADDFESGRVRLVERIHDDDRDIAEQLFSLVATDSPTTTNLRLRRRDGRISCIKASYEKSEAGAGILLTLRLQDVKSLKRTMEDITSMASLRAILENTDDYIFFKDRNHVFIGASQTVLSLCANSRHWTDLLGQTDYDVMPEAYADIYYRLEKQVFAGAPVAQETQETLGVDGRKGWIDNRKYPICNEQGHIVGLYSIARDVTIQVQGEEALRRERDNSRNLLETVEAIIVALDINGDITLINRKGCQLLGYDADDLQGRNWFDTCLPAERNLDQVRAVFHQALKDNLVGAEHFENRIRTRDGQELEIAWHNSVIRDTKGNIVGTLSAGNDITEREELHNRIEKIAMHVPGVIYQYQQWPDGHAAFPYASEGIRDIYGVEPAEVSTDATAAFDVIHPGDLSRVGAKIAESMHDLTTWHDAYRIKFPEGRVIWVEGEASPEPQPDGSVLWHGSIRDITERKQAEHRLRLASSVFAHSFEAIMVTDAENRIVDTNPAFSAITGYERASVLGKNPNVLASGRHDDAYYREMWDSITQKGFWRGEISNRRKDGEVYAELLSISVVHHAGHSVQNYIAVFSDISDIKAHEAELDRIANYDHLTGLPNRRLLGDRLEQAIAGTRRSGRLMAVCYLDLDAFKPINDQYGHDVGDQLLIGIANRLRKVLRAQDTVARLGGDEFVLLFNDLTRLEDSYVLLERVLAVSTAPIILRGVTHHVSASIGITLSPPDVDSADILLRHADQAMYRAKDAGRNRYHFYDSEQDRLVQNRRLKMKRIEAALAGQELVLYYQPKVDMVSRDVIGVEALIRWQHPEDGLLLPGAFLPVIEGSDLEIAIGEWVIAAAMTQVATWQRHGLNLPVSVNIGAGHLLDPSFAQRLESMLAEHPEFDPGFLEMEILETSALGDIERAGQTLTACRALGVRFALDDFGTGYSSLAYFRRLPIDVLKVDQSFVRSMLDDPDDMEIVESVVRLARAFNRLVIAEGVETPEHGALLTLLGCPLGQGFGIARPMPADAVPRWVSTWPGQGESMVVDKGISRDDIPLMMAMQNHRHWVDEFADALNDSDISRLGDIERIPCRLERWYQGSGSNHYGKLDEFHAVGHSHVKVHELASTMMALAEQGEMDSARLRLSSLFKACDELIAHLRALIGRLQAADK